MEEFDPVSVPIRPAATVMLIDDRPDLQVFMAERHAKTVFAGGQWVFPGGAVDPEDDPTAFEQIAVHRSDAEASAILGLDAGGLAYYLAAIRETFEEAGVLLALHEADESPLRFNPGNEAAFKRHRDLLNAGEISLRSLLTQEKLLADVGEMHYIGRWITPVGSPRRYDARFFLARIPEDQTPLHDDGELVNSVWHSPADIVAKYQAGEMAMFTPTLRMVRNLALFDSADHAISTVSANPPEEQARVHPKTGDILIPGEPGYDTGMTDIENGWIRLRPSL